MIGAVLISSDTYLTANQRGAANGVVPLDANSNVEITNLFSTVDISANASSVILGFITTDGQSAYLQAGHDDSVSLHVHGDSATEAFVACSFDQSWLSLNAPDDQATFTGVQTATGAYLRMTNGDTTGNGTAQLSFPSVSTVGSNNWVYTLPSNSGTIPVILSASATLDFGSTAAQSSSDLTISVPGSAVGDAVSIGLPASPAANTSFTAWVSAMDTVKVRHNNYSSGSVDPASGTYRAVVFKF